MKTRPWAIGKRLADFVCRHRQVQSNTPFAHWRAAAAVGLFYAALFVPVAAAQTIPVYPAGPPWRPVPSDEFQGRDLREELKNKMTDTFTVTSVGDMYWQSPVAKRMSPQLRDVMRNADTTVGNLEGGVGFDPEATASAMVDLGLDFVAPGEFGGSPVLQTAVQVLGKFGIKLSGAGPNLASARRPAFQELPQGRVAFLHACPGDNLCGPRATNTAQGVNPLGVTVWNTVTREQFDQLKAIEASILARRNEPDVLVPTEMPPPLPPGRLMLLGQRYIAAEKPGELRHELDATDEQAVVLAVRKRRSSPTMSFSTCTIISIATRSRRTPTTTILLTICGPSSINYRQRSRYVRGLRGSHDAGHRNLQGPPDLLQSGQRRSRSRARARFAAQSTESDGSESRERQRAGYLQSEDNSVAYVANTTYKDGRLVEIRLYPVDIGLGTRPWSRENIPLTPTPEKARSILERLQKYSEPFGTRISIENNIGIIRVPPGDGGCGW